MPTFSIISYFESIINYAIIMTEVPDCSGDDFKDDKGIQEERKKTLAHKKMIEDCFSIINDVFFIEPSSHRYFRSFHIFKSLKASVLKTVRSSQGSVKLVVSLVEYYSSYPIAKETNSSRDQYLFDRLEFNKSFPKTLICKETIREKISELFLKIETDFPRPHSRTVRIHACLVILILHSVVNRIAHKW